jgi:ADP-ribose pyrophosphatase YjhB (NUDIX family)
MDEHDFQYCQKLVILSKDKNSILLCKRKGESDYNETFTFPGGKMKTSDESIMEGIKREKDEELGENLKIKMLKTYTTNLLFKKSNGKYMIIPHLLAIHQEGEIELSDEYSEYKWVTINNLEEFEPKIKNIPDVIQTLNRLEQSTTEEDFILI